MTDPAAGLADVREIGLEADRAFEELRSLAHNVYPPALTDLGLRDALRALAAEAPIPVCVVADGVTRQPIEAESAIYFTCAEAVQNAVKHAAGATGVWITLTQTDDTLRFDVRDDGPGFTSAATTGRGLRNMHDRIEAIHGALTVGAAPGGGTHVFGSVPTRVRSGSDETLVAGTPSDSPQDAGESGAAPASSDRDDAARAPRP